MIYIVAILLLLLVLANETARGLLIWLLLIAVGLAAAGAALYVAFLVCAWVYSFNIPRPRYQPPEYSAPPEPGNPIVGYLWLAGTMGVCLYIAYDIWNMKRSPKSKNKA